LVARYDATQISGLNDGDTVTTWNDSSGLDHHATNGTAVYKVNIQNGLPVVRISSTKLDINFAQSANCTVFIAYRVTSSTGKYQQLLSRDTSNLGPAVYASNFFGTRTPTLFWSGTGGTY